MGTDTIRGFKSDEGCESHDFFSDPSKQRSSFSRNSLEPKCSYPPTLHFLEASTIYARSVGGGYHPRGNTAKARSKKLGCLECSKH
mmetsp:Transcript_11949/g.24674  ORF Transcript_11949/g.24674 Transcript_11949/m.24674 type:complete len:86 (+) Transcript_11949:1158-1415(+)